MSQYAKLTLLVALTTSVGSAQEPQWADISMKTTHSCGVTTDGVVYCWGWGSAGQLGQGSRDPSIVPVKVVERYAPMVNVEVGDQSTCSFDSNGDRWCWGDANGAMSAQGRTPQKMTPGTLSNGYTNFRTVSLGEHHACGLESNNDLVSCWGDNTRGQQGWNPQRTIAMNSAPGVTGLASGNGRASQIAFSQVVTGLNHTCAVTRAGVAYCWGVNSRRELGNGDTEDSFVPLIEPAMGNPNDRRYIRAQQEYMQQLGEAAQPRSLIGEVDTDARFRSLAAGLSHTCGVTMDGRAYCWGLDQDVKEVRLNGNQLTEIAVGGRHACGISSSGAAMCWGAGEGGQLGTGRTVDSERAVPCREVCVFKR